VHYHFEEMSSALNTLSVHLKQKWFKETFKIVQIKCVIIYVHRETVPCWWASERECPSASCCKSVTRNGKFSTDSRTQMTTARYGGPIPCRHLWTDKHSLNVTRSGTSNQCRISCRTCDRSWSNFRVFVMTRCRVHYSLQLVSHHLWCTSQQTIAIFYTTRDKCMD